MRFFKRNEIAVSKFIFRDILTGEAIDVDNAQYSIVYYAGPTENIVVATTVLDKLAGRTGEYVCSWEIPGTALENETYFVRATGTHPINLTNLVLEDFYRVLTETYFPGSNGGMVVKFTKP
ncbi:MAG: hypothetical protein PHF86_04250 [Candidatus Nanoarchaeia archaeon]|jgi:hypothetical protein|nr:hypothetical protein [Candidatus Nanoarchaeia archaeon]